LGNGVPQEFHTFQPEFTFAELSIKLMISQSLKNNSEVFGMFFLVFGVDEDIIDKDHYEFVELRHKHGVHEVHELRWGICKTVTPAFLAPNKSPNKSCVFSKLSSRAQLPLSEPWSPSPSLTLGARAANPAGTARTQASTHACHPSAAVGHRAGNPAHAAVPTAGPPRHHRRPKKHADARKSVKSHKNPFP
jgi:hypothetical protein